MSEIHYELRTSQAKPQVPSVLVLHSVGFTTSADWPKMGSVPRTPGSVLLTSKQSTESFFQQQPPVSVFSSIQETVVGSQQPPVSTLSGSQETAGLSQSLQTVVDSPADKEL